MTEPLWRSRAPTTTYSCDLAVIGAGIAGVASALHAQRMGASVIILDRCDIASGASSRNAGFLMRGAADNYAAAINTLGHQQAQHLWKLTEDNLAALRKEGIESLNTYQQIPSALLALTETEADQLTRSARLLSDDGFSTQLIHSGTDAVWQSGNPILALINPDDAAINPCELVHFLAAKLDRPPLTHCAVRSILADDSSVSINSDKLTIRAQRAIVCTNAYTSSLLPQLNNLISPNRGQMLAFSVPKPMLDCSYYANHGSEYFRQPDHTTIVAGGWRKHFAQDEQTEKDETTDAVQSGIESFIRSLLPLDDAPVITRWAGIMGFTPDALPITGPTDPTNRIWTCAGFTGHGMSLAYKTAQLTVNALLNGTPPPFPLGRFNCVTPNAATSVDQ